MELSWLLMGRKLFLMKHMSVRGIWDENMIVGIFGTTVGSHHMTVFQFPRLDLFVYP